MTTALEPGNYFIVDTYSGDGAMAKPGAAVKFEVRKNEDADFRLPRTSAEITETDYGFAATGIRAGRNRVTLRNRGLQQHELIAYRLFGGMSVEDVRRGYREGTPPALGVVDGARAAVLDAGEAQIQDMEFTRGTYALVCLLSDRDGGPTHAEKGMVSRLVVRR